MKSKVVFGSFWKSVPFMLLCLFLSVSPQVESTLLLYGNLKPSEVLQYHTSDKSASLDKSAFWKIYLRYIWDVGVGASFNQIRIKETWGI